MTTSSGSLAAAFESSGIKEVTPEPNNNGGQAGDTSGGIVIPPMRDPADISIPFVTDEPDKGAQPDPVVTGSDASDPAVGDQGNSDPAGEGDQIDYFKEFAEAIGFEGEVTGSSFDDLKVIGQAAIAQYKEKLDEFSNMFSSDLVEHIKAGGSVESFYSYEQPTNNFQDAKFEDDDVENREALLNDFYSRQGIETDQAEMLINNMKDKGTFNTFSDKVLEQYKTAEKAENERIIAARKADEQAAIEKNNQFIKEVTESFDKGLTGVTVDKEILTEARRVSTPDTTGKFGIHDIKLTPAQETVVNTLIVALSKGKSFAYSPTKAVSTQNGGVKPITAIFNKDNKSGQQAVKGTLEDMNAIFEKRRN